ncbi:hypothetical protein BU23DRAFT_596838 [Bimuria novae-zelandiae CBS 107.79]|uniref:Heterokaryon incompatibility domain-containing protein n=1 Tax=Bimuria novae-zelandiae CBS 107.79 TaxID=1447943 RepID=A0A6A5VI62_9PLEO|nr:hypothetical protein BU23DRAFT_596838 [Bimuria novae-zelandiae CBS 107.79]
MSELSSGRHKLTRVEELNNTKGVPLFLRHLFHKTYWGRAWIVQEIMLARRATVVLGRKDLPLLGLMTILEPRLFSQWVREASQFLAPKDMFQGASLIRLLDHFRGKKCGDPRDRVYSLIPIAGEGRDLTVGYALPPLDLMFRTLASCPSSLCIGSAMAVGHALKMGDRDQWGRPYIEPGISYAVIFAQVLDILYHGKRGLLFAASIPDSHEWLTHALDLEHQSRMGQSSVQPIILPDSVMAQALKIAHQGHRRQLLLERGAASDAITIKAFDIARGPCLSSWECLTGISSLMLFTRWELGSDIWGGVFSYSTCATLPCSKTGTRTSIAGTANAVNLPSVTVSPGRHLIGHVKSQFTGVGTHGSELVLVLWVFMDQNWRSLVQ